MPCHKKYRGSAHRGCNISVKLNHLKKLWFSSIMQELRKFNLKISVTANGLETYMSFTINSKLSFIGSLQFLSSSLHSLVKYLNKDDFKNLNQEIDNNVLGLVKQKRFYRYRTISHKEDQFYNIFIPFHFSLNVLYY